jgi:hypothetical protein
VNLFEYGATRILLPITVGFLTARTLWWLGAQTGRSVYARQSTAKHD